MIVNVSRLQNKIGNNRNDKKNLQEGQKKIHV